LDLRGRRTPRIRKRSSKAAESYRNERSRR
jgi:hypothetical protein